MMLEKITETNSDVAARGKWARKAEFILSAMGYAIGIGNVWRFPYLCYRNGGGAFLVPYLLMLFLCGVPLFFMETVLGQFSSLGCISVFKICPLWKGVGYAIVVVNFICSSYYNVIISYPLYFLAESLTSQLPWETCDNEWNTEKCVKFRIDGQSQINLTFINSSEVQHLSSLVKTPADEFFHGHILQITPDINTIGGMNWPLLLCNVISWACVYLCIMNGVKSVGKVVYFTATFPFLILFILFIRGITLPGAVDGILFYITPQWDQLLKLKVWSDAAVQIFYSLGPGWGGIINMASYNQFKNNSKWDAIIVPIMNCSTSIFAGFVVFSVLGFMSHKTGIPVSSVATGGPGLAFVTYPEAITLLPLAPLWAILFFIMLYLLGLDSMFVQIEAIISSVLDEVPRYRKNKKLFTLFSCFIMFLVSLSCVTKNGMYVLQLMDWYSASFSVILICIIEALIVGWIYGVGKFVRDLEFMIGKRITFWWPLCWKFITPAVLLFIFFASVAFNTPPTYNNVPYPVWARGIGWVLAGSSMIWIPVYVVWKLIRTKGPLWQRVKVNLHARSDWCPSDEIDKRDWRNYCAEHPTRWFS